MSDTMSRKSRSSKVEGIAFEESGPEGGPVIVFGHSLLFDHRMWAPQVAELSKDFRCVALDFPGHGGSDEPRRGHTMRDNAEAYRVVMDHLGIERAVLVGLSMGGMAAMPFALAHPGRVAGLVLMDTSADVEPPAARARNTAMAVTARWFGFPAFIIKKVNALMWSERARRERPELVSEWEGRVKTLPRPGLYRAVMAVMKRPSVMDKLGELKVPTLVIAGEEDAATAAEVNRAIAERIAGADLKLLPRTGHIANLEEPEVVTKLIRAFMSRLG